MLSNIGQFFSLLLTKYFEKMSGNLTLIHESSTLSPSYRIPISARIQQLCLVCPFLPLSFAPSLSSMAVQDLGTSRIRSVAEGQFELK